MPDTFYTVSPHWGWFAVVEFFVAGLAGTSAGIAALLWLFSRNRDDRLVARWGFGIAMVGSVLSGLLLIADLKRPDRFWHMLLFSETLLPTFLKWWSVMALGAWALFVFGGTSFLILVGSLAEAGRLPRGLAFLGREPIGTILAFVAGLAGTFYAGYKGVLLNATNRPLWGDTVWLGALFFASGMAAACALLLLITRRRAPATSTWLGQLLFGALGVTLVVALGLLFTLQGSVLRLVLGNVYGVILALTLVFGVLLPLILTWRPQLLGRYAVPSLAVLVLAGAFFLRVAVILSSEAA
ncbi:polysulfide reductase NrfD [Thermomicrobium sp. CFH 73360]|uniref:NrfD/PsrC family molybdoenzyme membrane anchor subunit n=1 Tax=Thermomicrobium sp. CFH 73360 TaxID=2951987 RepID=UPI002077669E|nr:NrfD/PsrC family molybdoenzyme membrane anchor subunit [Thermomicrobium sp. CFH 73360]MCM8746312.1 polysulfide reductase NrfD [Thermomicrobium sp. CFH 73360]